MGLKNRKDYMIIDDEAFNKTESETDEIPDAKARYDICRQCDSFSPLKICNECGCFMPLKVRIKSVTCPLKKW